LVYANRAEVEFYVCSLTNEIGICNLEHELLAKLRPVWNKQLG
jgi:hypothetical protein